MFISKEEIEEMATGAMGWIIGRSAVASPARLGQKQFEDQGFKEVFEEKKIM